MEDLEGTINIEPEEYTQEYLEALGARVGRGYGFSTKFNEDLLNLFELTSWFTLCVLSLFEGITENSPIYYTILPLAITNCYLAYLRIKNNKN